MGTNMPEASLTVRDYSDETSNFSLGIIRITAALLPAFLTDWGTFRTATEGITLGIMASERAQVFNTVLDGTLPTDPLAQREVKWQVKGIDVREFLDAANTVPNPFFGRPIYMEVPTADMSKLLPNSDLADPADADVAAWVTAAETIWRSDADGQIEVQELRLVGRNL